MNEQAVVAMPDLEISKNSVAVYQEQLKQLVAFVQSQLKEGIDYGTIPGTKKPSLYKPGAEKLGALFQLGSRILEADKVVDVKDGFAMFTYRVEIFHLPTGKTVSQCEGSCNSREKKYIGRPMYDQLNTISKMAQKRAFVGAMMNAVRASDFFTQDLEDMDPAAINNKPGNQWAMKNFQPADDEGGATNPNAPYTIPFGKFRMRSLEEVGSDQLRGYIDYMEKTAAKKGVPIQGEAKEFIDRASQFIADEENEIARKFDQRGE
jgi:hypothetical protein